MLDYTVKGGDGQWMNAVRSKYNSMNYCNYTCLEKMKMMWLSPRLCLCSAVILTKLTHDSHFGISDFWAELLRLEWKEAVGGWAKKEDKSMKDLAENALFILRTIWFLNSSIQLTSVCAQLLTEIWLCRNLSLALFEIKTCWRFLTNCRKCALWNSEYWNWYITTDNDCCKHVGY